MLNKLCLTVESVPHGAHAGKLTTSNILKWKRPGDYHTVGYPSEKPKSPKISLAHNWLLSDEIVLNFCTEHGSITAVLCVNFQNDLTDEMGVLEERDFTRFEFNMSFEQISHIATIPWVRIALHPSLTRCNCLKQWQRKLNFKYFSQGTVDNT